MREILPAACCGEIRERYLSRGVSVACTVRNEWLAERSFSCWAECLSEWEP